MNYKKELELVDTKLISISKKTSKNENEDFYRLSIRVPVIRKIKSKEKLFTDYPDREKILIWSHIWENSKYFESMSLALYNYQHKTLSKIEINHIFKWVERCVCWEHSDDLSKIFALALEEQPKLVYPVLLKWNKSKNLWKRRQSLVSLIEYHGKRKKVLPFNKLSPLIINLLNDKEYYVQKGLGWTLREVHSVYPEKGLSFIKKYLFDISPVAYSAATEKLNKRTKTEFKNLRKLARQN